MGVLLIEAGLFELLESPSGPTTRNVTEKAEAVADLARQNVRTNFTRRSGTLWFVQMHVELPAELTLEEAHARCEAVSAAIRAEFPQSDVLVHADPCHTPEGIAL